MNGSVSFGTTLPRWSGWAGPEGCRRVPVAAEECGYDWVGRGDHIVFTEDEESWAVDLPTADAFGVLSYVAAVTDRVRVGTNICGVPYRHPVTLAKQAFTLDVLSEGRFEFGVGPGWCEPEFDLLDVPYSERGSRTDEFLDLFEAACESPVVDFEGPHHRFEGVGFHPRPVRDGGPPVMVGGFSGTAFRRTAEYGDGWTYGTGDPAEVAEARRRIEPAWSDFDRRGSPAIAVNYGAHIDDTLDADDDPSPLIGPPDAVIEGVQRYVDAGATRVSPDFSARTNTVDDQVKQIRRFASEVMPSFAR